MSDPTESIRRQRLVELNSGDTTRVELEAQYGQVWSTDELTDDFDALGFMAPRIALRVGFVISWSVITGSLNIPDRECV